jgi:hypothetical protein
MNPDPLDDISVKLAEIARLQTHDQLNTYLDGNNITNAAVRTLFHMHLSLVQELNLCHQRKEE